MLRSLRHLLLVCGILIPGLLLSQDSSARKKLQARVWVNTSSGVYHCPDSQHYGKTKAGEYMSEAQARGSGHRANGGRACADSSERDKAPQPLAEKGDATKVWVNTSSGVYHCPGSATYGTTKRGTYMSEDEAREAGHRAAGGRSCGG